MKNKLVARGLSLALTGLVTVSTIAPIFATVTETQSTSENVNMQTEVIYNQMSNFTVTIPKTVELDSSKTSDYTVTISGDISSDEVVNVVPDKTFLMKDVSGAENLKADVTATVTQDKTSWLFNEFETVGNGNISAEDLTSGSWKGSFWFNISLEDLENNEFQEPVTLEAGLYDENGVMLCTWEESGIDVEADFSGSNADDNYFKTAQTSGYYILTNVYPNATKIVLPDDIETMGDYAFRECENLTEIILPDGLTIMPIGAFYHCVSLTNIDIPDSVVYLHGGLFNGCSNLTSVKLPSSFKETEDYVFYNCSSLASVTYKETTYTSQSEIMSVLKNNNVQFGICHEIEKWFYNTKLSD